MEFRLGMEQKYKQILHNYIRKQDEQALYLGQKFSRRAIEDVVPPEEIINLHRITMKELFPDLSEEILASYDFLLEIMMGYGLAYQEHQSLRTKQQELKSEIEIAANVQQTLIETSVPNHPSLDLGAISVPANIMNGDYFHFVDDEEGNISMAIADVIGKGIPAAMCMSMIKYSMDSLPDSRMCPKNILRNLNRVVEHNIDVGMFVTMLYGIYRTQNHTFTYSSAGHEPGFYYHSDTNQFTDMSTTNGLVLGIDRKTNYTQIELEIKKGDMIILLSDGVTECRVGNSFIEREEVTRMIRKYLHLSAQEMVEGIYQEFEKLSNYELRDDFTMIILKRKV